MGLLLEAGCQAGEPVTSDQEADGDEMPGCSVAARLGLGRLQQRVHRLDIAGVQVSGLKSIDDPCPMLLDCFGQLFDRMQL